MGHDWEGEFDFLKDQCEVIYLKRTEGISTTQIKKNYTERKIKQELRQILSQLLYFSSFLLKLYTIIVAHYTAVR